MREQILELIQTKPKHFSKLVSSNPNLLTWVQQNTLVQSTNLSEMIYSALHKETNLCKNGKIKKFDRISTGFIGCGPAKMCSCTKNAISSNVSASKQLYTSDQKIQINEKRKQTMISKYGVPYNLQRSDVKQNAGYRRFSTCGNLKFKF